MPMLPGRSPLRDATVRAAFLAHLAGSRSIRRTAAAFGIARRTVYRIRAQDEAFDAGCATHVERQPGRVGTRQRAAFLETLAATGDAAAAAAEIGQKPEALFRMRARDTGFAAAWAAAMAEAVERLEAKAIAAALKDGAGGQTVAVLRMLGPARRNAAAAQGSLGLAVSTRERLLQRIAEIGGNAPS